MPYPTHPKKKRGGEGYLCLDVKYHAVYTYTVIAILLLVTGVCRAWYVHTLPYHHHQTQVRYVYVFLLLWTPMSVL